ncbi:hypothetical protein [Sulfurimonas sp.]|uniref:hypothetical protein n=1 Tax=Sulfurimonas sp. TaxID=2022749 RepID=UPI00356A641F
MSDNLDLNVEESGNQEIENKKLKDNYEALKKIGAQKIHEQTHIPKIQCEDLVNGYFESMNKIQFTGFVSILEREYSLDLRALKAEGLSFFEGKDMPDIAESKVFITPKKTKNYTTFYIIAAILIFLVVLFGLSSDNKKIEPKIDNKKIEQVTSKIIPKEIPDENTTVEVKEEPQVQKELSPLKIIPNVKLWVGYINLNTGRKLQKIVPEFEALELDPKGHWLLSLGHGDVTFDVNGEVEKFKESRNIRLLYKDGELKKITYREFLALNKGREW